MKRIIFVLSMLIGVAYGQTTGYFRYDTVTFQKIGGTSEFNLRNATRGVTGGVLTNMGNGRTAFVTPSAGTVTAANNGLFLSGSTVQLGATSQVLAATIPFTSDRFMDMGTFPNRRSLTMFSDVSSVIPSYPTDNTVFTYPGRIDFKTADGGAINFYVLDSAGTFGSSFPSISYRSGYNGTLQAFTGMHWNPAANSTHFDLVDLRGSLTSAQIQAGGVGTAIFQTDGFTYLGRIGSKRTGFGGQTSTSQIPQTVTILGSFSVSDSALFQKKLFITDSTGFDIMMSQRASPYVTKMMTVADLSAFIAGGSTPGLQQVFDVESGTAVMTASATNITDVNGGSYSILSGVTPYTSMGLVVDADNANTYLVGNSGAALIGTHDGSAQIDFLSNSVGIRGYGPDSLVLMKFSDYTKKGIKYTPDSIMIRSLTHSGNSADVMLVQDSVTGLIAHRPIPSGGAVAWNAITAPTGDQALPFDAGETIAWTSSNTSEDLLTITSVTATTGSLINLNSATGVPLEVTGGTGSSSNYAARFTGRVAMAGVTTPFSDLDLGNGSIATGSLIVTTAAGTNQTGNFATGSQGLISTNVGSIYQILGSTTSQAHVYIGGTGATSVNAGNPGSILTIGAGALVENTTLAHPLFSSLTVKAPTITSGAATLTNQYTVYIEGAPAGTATNTGSLWVGAGLSRFDGGINLNGASSPLQLNTSAGTSGQLLTSAGAATTPTWSNFSSLLSTNNITSGTYTPSLTNVTNISASTAYECQYLRVGNTVTVSGKVDIDVTLGAASELGMSLPIASAFTADENLGGTGSSAAAASLVSAIRADATNDRAAFVFTAVSLTNDSYYFEFTYRIL